MTRELNNLNNDENLCTTSQLRDESLPYWESILSVCEKIEDLP